MNSSANVRLAATALTDFWSKEDKDILLLGEWCLTQNNREERSGNNYQVFPYHFADASQVYDAYIYCERIYETYLEELTKVLNRIHKVDRDARYWRIIIGPWLYHYIQVLYDRYLAASRVLQDYPGLEMVGLHSENFVVYNTGWEAIRNAWEDLYNLQLFTQIFFHLGAKITFRSAPESLPETYPKTGASRLLSNYLRNQNLPFKILANFSYLLARGQIWTFHLYLPLNLVARLVISAKFKAYPLDPILFPLERIKYGPVNHKLRYEVKESLRIKEPVDNPFTDLLSSTLPENLPLVYLEGFQLLTSRLKIFQKYRPAAMISAVGYEVSDPWRFLAADKAGSGTKLIGVQHGGGYGSFQLTPIEEHEHKVVDRWWSWGWTRPGQNITEPMPNPKMSELRKKFQGLPHPGEYLLVVAGACPRYLYRMWTAPVGPQGKTYRAWLLRFLQSVSRGIPILFRPHHYWADVEEEAFIKENFPDITLDDLSASLYDRMKRARVVVSDNNHTTPLESLMVDKPTVIFFDPDLWGIRPEAKPYFDMLREARILFYSPEEAGEHVLSIFARPQAWWNNPQVQKARECFVNRFALTSDDWLTCWKQAFGKMIHG